MTVAAVILAASTGASARSETSLLVTVDPVGARRLADSAWSGGALPIVFVWPDEDPGLAAALAPTEAILVPVPDTADAAGRISRGIEAACAEVRETTAALAWPAAMVWVGPETVTSLIEAHGSAPEAIVCPTWNGEPGWPILLPVGVLDQLAVAEPGATASEVIAGLSARAGERRIEVGDPGVVHDVRTEQADLPPYEGPPEPAGGHVHEWGDDIAVAAGPDDS